jgi:hypothetical protein
MNAVARPPKEVYKKYQDEYNADLALLLEAYKFRVHPDAKPGEVFYTNTSNTEDYKDNPKFRVGIRAYDRYNNRLKGSPIFQIVKKYI